MADENVWLAKDANEFPVKLLPYYTLIETNSEDNVLLGACNLGGSYWNGKLWYFQKPEDAISLRKGLAINVDSGASAVKFLPSGKHIIVADYSGHLSLIEIQRAAKDCPSFFVPAAEFWGHDDFVTSVDVNENGTEMVTGAMDDCVTTWDVETATMKSKFAHADSVKSVAFLPEKHTSFATACQDGRAFLWDTRLDKPACQIADEIAAYTSVEWIDNLQGALSCINGSVTIFDVRKSPLKKFRLCTDHGVRRLRANRSLNLLAAAVDDLTVRVFDCSEGNLTPLFESQSHSDFPSGLAWSSKSRLLLSSGWDSKIFSHSIPTEANIPQLVPEGKFIEENCVDA